MNSETVRILILIPVCNMAGNGDNNNRNPKSKTPNDSFRDGWERTFAQTKNLNMN